MDCSSTRVGLRTMNFISLVLIVGASVSSGYSGKPSGEWLAEWLNVPVVNEARTCQVLTETVAAMQVPPNSLGVNLDASYWDSYQADCAEPVKAVKTFYAKSHGSRVLIATVPLRDAGGFYKWWCEAKTEAQSCRLEINAAIKGGCVGNCVLIDADEVYRGRENEDIHLAPDVWKDEARKLMARLHAIR